MEFSEKFIDENVAILAERYDKIHGQNVNIARISPDFIDGLKPVQRRALYVMYLKDGGKTFRKLASITGDTFGKVHPHSPTAISGAVVNIAQPWHNSIPLVTGEGNWGDCHDDQTKVLVRGGWKYFKDLTENDELASVNPEDNTLIFEKPVRLIGYEYDGMLIHTCHHSLDFAVTPNHKMVVSKYNSHNKEFEKFEFVKAKDLPSYSRLISKVEYKNENSDDVVILEEEEVQGKMLPEMIIPMDIWVQFIGIYLSDGCMFINGKNKKSTYKTIRIAAASKTRKMLYYSDILEAMGIKNNEWSEKTKGFQIINKRIWNKLESYGLTNKKSYDKFVPKFIFDLDSEYIKKFLYAFSMGDGSKDKACVGTSFWTSSKQLAEDLSILSFMSGSPAMVDVKEPRKGGIVNGKQIISRRPNYHVYQWVSKNQSIDKRMYVKEIPYKGMVYCAEVPTYHTLVTMRNGKILISGNCSGSRAGADRYIKAKLSDYSIACFFEDWKDSVVDMEMAYDEETMMPLYLPAKYPNVLINGCLGIGYGSSSNICCFNFREVVEATILLMHNPKANIVLIPDSPTGADIIEQDFARLCNVGVGSYKQRSTYEIDPDKNVVTITSLPDLTTANQVCERIADFKSENKFQELLNMNDLSGVSIKIELELRDTANPYKFIKKLFKEVPGFVRTYPINITVVNDYENKDYSIKELLVEWIKWRRDQKRSVVNNKRAKLMAEQRTNDVKIFIMNPKNLEETIKIFRTSRNREEIEKKLIDRYHDTEIQMDSLQARALSNMRMIELTIEAYEGCLKRAEELKRDLDELEVLLNTENGIDKLIVAELRDGLKRFGTPRKSNVVPEKIDTKNEVEGNCILQLSSDGIILRKQATNAEEEPIPNDVNGFACLVDNDSSFIIVTETGSHSFIKVNDIPIDNELPVTRYARKEIEGKRIVAMLPIDMDKDLCAILISKKGIAKRIRILDIKSSSKNLMALNEGDSIVRGIVMPSNSKKELLVYTDDGMGQRVSSNDIRITSPNAGGIEYFKIKKNDEIVGVYSIAPEQNQYLLYVTVKAKTRLNNISFLPLRNSKHDEMVKLINLGQRDKLLAVIGCNKLDKVQLFFNDGDSETIDVNKMKESTMGEEPTKIAKKNVVSCNVVKVKLI